MKYNISNWDQFKDKATNPFETMIDKIATRQKELLESKIKELIEPYINIEVTDFEELKREFESKKYELTIEDHADHKEYIITYIPTKKFDYFSELYKANLGTDNDKYSIETYFTEIIRGI